MQPRGIRTFGIDAYQPPPSPTSPDRTKSPPAVSRKREYLRSRAEASAILSRDLGSLTPDNMLIVSGRLNNILNIGGEKIAAERIEAVLPRLKALLLGKGSV
jgi:acyl-CoA synthetase (AMP-forming)/AMP-acid ligase II